MKSIKWTIRKIREGLGKRETRRTHSPIDRVCICLNLIIPFWSVTRSLTQSTWCNKHGSGRFGLRIYQCANGILIIQLKPKVRSIWRKRECVCVCARMYVYRCSLYYIYIYIPSTRSTLYISTNKFCFRYNRHTEKKKWL